MRYNTVVALLFIAFAQPLYAQTAAAGEETLVEVAEGAPLRLECAVAVQARAEWRLDGRAPPPDLAAAGEAPRAGGGLAARLAAPAARAHHAGRYTCSRDPAGPALRVRVLPAGGAAPGEQPPLREHEFDLGKPITLNCSAAFAELNDVAFAWWKNNASVATLEELEDRYELSAGGAVLNVSRGHEHDYGEYECRAGGAARARWAVAARPIAKLPPDASAVEGQHLNLTCRLLGKPPRPVRWYYSRSADANASAVPAEEHAGAERLALADTAAGVPNGSLLLSGVRLEDAGVYWCAPAGGVRAHSTLRVKDMYAALWPFLGICAEVFVLCAIILVYEKRRTKPELDDSDTDNHDQ